MPPGANESNGYGWNVRMFEVEACQFSAGIKRLKSFDGTCPGHPTATLSLGHYGLPAATATFSSTALKYSR